MIPFLPDNLRMPRLLLLSKGGEKDAEGEVELRRRREETLRIVVVSIRL